MLHRIIINNLHPIEGDPGHMSVRWIQSSCHGGVGMHQFVSKACGQAGVNTRPGHRGSIELKTL